MPEKVDAPTSGQNTLTDSPDSPAGNNSLSKTVSEKKIDNQPLKAEVDMDDTIKSSEKIPHADVQKPTTTLNQSSSTIQASKPIPLPLPKIKLQSTPIQIPKVINTPEGTIPLNSNINNSMKKSNNSNNSKSNNSHSTKASTATNKTSGGAKLTSASKPSLSASNAQTSSTCKVSKHNENGLVPIQPNPNTAPSIQFHPIAIKPKPKSIQSISAKTRSKSVSLSRSNSVSGVSKKEQQVPHSNSTITLSTSKNWVLPPRPKTKKISKKKEKKVVKSNLGDINISKTGPVMVKKLPTSTTTSASPSPSPSLTSDALSPNSLLSNTLKTKISSSLVKENGVGVIKDKSSVSSPVHNSSKCTSPKCTICTKVCIANGIRSVYQDKVTGKVLINAQIHSNINLYTNNEKELEVQLQHVTRENDNLKKILLKLNKEIQNLRIAKKKEDISSQCTKKIKSAKLERSSTPMDINLPHVEKESAKPADFECSNTISTNTINPVNLSFTTESKRQKINGASSVLESTSSDYNDTKKTNTNKPKQKAKSKKSSTTITSKKHHPCGICEINSKCTCTDYTAKSIASGIVQAFSGGNSKILGIGNQSGVSALNARGSASTLSTMLHREEIMKKFKEDVSYSGNNIDQNNSFSTVDMIDKDLNTNDEKIMSSTKFEEDDSLLQMIDTELLLDPTPMVPSKLMKKSTSLQTIKEQVPASTSMKKSESRTSEQNSMDYFNRGTLMDFNPFNSNEMMMHDDFNELNNDTKFNDILKSNNDVPMTVADHDNNDNSIHNTLLFENSIYSGDEFMMY